MGIFTVPASVKTGDEWLIIPAEVMEKLVKLMQTGSSHQKQWSANQLLQQQ